MSDLDRLFTKMDDVQAAVEDKIEKLDSKMEGKLDGLDAKFDAKTDKLQAQIGGIAEHLARVQACSEEAKNTAKRVNGEFHAQQTVCAERFGRLGGARTAIAIAMSMVAILVAAGTLVWRLVS